MSRILLCSYPLEFGIALTYSISGCAYLAGKEEESFESVTEVVEAPEAEDVSNFPNS